ncbi:L-2,4-diaminobutyric acid acetyltransferase [Gracilibacillus boraciitolerans JCM 21714]|uniref:L-2,4-diaminobutyric acid acetyltransferase n=1 Tax=Gracilibacillus boraciitolerans JCM 21714 TaxID=1298598 RepID=W4VJB4_9BACI|nr:diaminobutyrate acetyltransferase [Gracilibacillus boraciitolerans]GAE93475.1 L-2,4-diaminobutyric acid acetyltransferase [Gracilibacillus boraciitolerans JCM 21714]
MINYKNNSTPSNEVVFSQPTKHDGAALWELVANSTLDTNSSYKYILMSEYFSDTCVVAKQGNQVVGFITAFIPPKKQDAVFVWQVGVDASQRGKGIASNMLHHLLNSEGCQNVKFVEATITPSNKASQSLFQKLARDFQTDITSSEFFTKDIFPGDEHEEELKFIVGPINK